VRWEVRKKHARELRRDTDNDPGHGGCLFWRCGDFARKTFGSGQRGEKVVEKAGPAVREFASLI